METVEIREFRLRIGRAIRSLREKEGISSRFLAKVLGVTQPTISRIENGTTSLSAERLCFLARVYNRPLSSFVGEQSPLVHSEEDILRAAAVHFGARHLKCKRTIDVHEHYKTYADFLRAALSVVEQPRFAAAVAATLYQQAAHDAINVTRIITSLPHERLVVNLRELLRFVIACVPSIDRSATEKRRVRSVLQKLNQALGHASEVEQGHSDVPEMSAAFFMPFVNAESAHG